jgi:tetratricopeptide (TPR) repeat protein
MTQKQLIILFTCLFMAGPAAMAEKQLDISFNNIQKVKEAADSLFQTSPDSSKVLELRIQQLELAKKSGQYMTVLAAYTDLTNYAMWKKDYPGAEKFITEQVQIAEGLPNGEKKRQLLYALGRRASLYELDNKTEAALQDYSAVLDIYNELVGSGHFIADAGPISSPKNYLSPYVRLLNRLGKEEKGKRVEERLEFLSKRWSMGSPN